eukprot:GSMAST32.ASY1.ANO1.1685.1 assembled CDS
MSITISHVDQAKQLQQRLAKLTIANMTDDTSGCVECADKSGTKGETKSSEEDQNKQKIGEKYTPSHPDSRVKTEYTTATFSDRIFCYRVNKDNQAIHGGGMGQKRHRLNLHTNSSVEVIHPSPKRLHNERTLSPYSEFWDNYEETPRKHVQESKNSSKEIFEEKYFNYGNSLISSVIAGLQSGLSPTPVDSICSGGAYFMRSPGRRIAAVFKPTDEEPYAKNNPKSYLPRDSRNEISNEESIYATTSSKSKKYTDMKSTFTSMGMKSGIGIGKGAVRECAAYLLDKTYEKCFAGVPQTTVVKFHNNLSKLPPHPPTSTNNEVKVDDVLNKAQNKTGSLQVCMFYFFSIFNLFFVRNFVPNDFFLKYF